MPIPEMLTGSGKAPSHIEEIIEALKSILAHVSSEDEVCGRLEASLSSLRSAYRANATEFLPDDIEALKRLRCVLGQVRRFAELQEELIGAIDLHEYSQAMHELKALAQELGDFAVARRVRKEIRQLAERRVEVLEYEELRRHARITERMLKLEAGAEDCPRCAGRLQIKDGKAGRFWACNMFPSCWFARSLTGDQQRFLEDGAPDSQ